MPLVIFESIGNIGVIRLNNPPVNALSQPLRETLVDVLDEARDKSIDALLIMGGDSVFSAGADISEFSRPPRDPVIRGICAVIENYPKPVIAALRGIAIGGGFELALACHYRCASPGAKVSLPELQLGLIPGGGGTQRVPRLSGIGEALKLMMSGKPLPAGKALELGLVDKLVEGEDFLAGAIKYGGEVVAEGLSLRKARDKLIDPASLDYQLFDDFLEMAGKKYRGQSAPVHLISSIRAAVELPFEEGLDREGELFQVCRKSSQSAGLRHLFFAEKESSKLPGSDQVSDAGLISSVGIVGCGTMGSGLAMVFANAGLPVEVLVRNEESRNKAVDRVRKGYQLSVKKGKLTEEKAEEKIAFIEFTPRYEDLSEADLVIEAVYEDLELKKKIFSRLDKYCREGAILATNTSYQSISSIACATGRPRDVIGLHFFAPANVMKLLEIVRGEETSAEVIASCVRLARGIGKIPVLAGDSYGFIGNRMYRRYVRETQFCLLEGAEPEQVDRAMEEWGMAMGPLAVGDLTGLDIGYKARQALPDEEKGDPRGFCINDTLAEMGRLGRKTGRGYYLYDPETRGRKPDPEVMDVIREQSFRYGVKRREMADEEIVDRLILSLVNEGVTLLEEGVAGRAGDIDVVFCNGYGFPRFRGGPMFYADTVGLRRVCDSIGRFRDGSGDQAWAVNSLLEQYVREGKRLSERRSK